MAMSPDEIVSEYPTLTLSDVHAALAYYDHHRDELDRDIREDGEVRRAIPGRTRHPFSRS